jgi:hypothetical protein
MWFLTINSLKSTSSPINLIFEHVQYVIGPIAIFQYWWQFSILMQLTCLMWQTRHPTISWIDVEDWLYCIQDNASDMLFNRLKKTMCIACIVMGDSIDNPRLVCVGLRWFASIHIRRSSDCHQHIATLSQEVAWGGQWHHE